MFSQAPPKPHPLPYSPRAVNFMDIHPEEMARQITLVEHDLYKSIKPWELLEWNSKDKHLKSPHILNMINKFNHMNKWVQVEILKAGESVRQRAAIFGRFLEICGYMKELNNFNGMMEILSAINSTAIYRLKLTWAALGSKQLELYEELNELLSSNCAYKSLRATIHNIQPPCIPYMGMYLSDLTFLNDGNPKYLENGYINFDKCRRMSAVIREIIQYQQTPYCLLKHEEIQQYLQAAEVKNEDYIYNLSLQAEGRQVADKANTK